VPTWIDSLAHEVALREKRTPSVAEIALRCASRTDEPALYRVHREAMIAYVDATWGWDETWQREHFANTFSPRRNAIVVRANPGSAPLGRISITRHWRSIFLRDIELAPELRNRGIGGALLDAVLALARREHKSVELHVLRCNPAQRLYVRRGFEVTSADDARLTMRAQP